MIICMLAILINLAEFYLVILNPFQHTFFYYLSSNKIKVSAIIALHSLSSINLLVLFFYSVHTLQ